MRNDLKNLEGISGVETDVDERTVRFQAGGGIDISSMLDELVETNDKLKEWELIESD